MSLSRFEEELLRSAPDDAPSAERRRANRALVMGAAGLAAAAGAGAAAATTAGAGGGGAVAVATKGIGLAKLAIVVAIALGAGAAVLGLTRHGAGARDGSPTTPAQTPAQTSAPAPIASPPPPVAALPPDESGPQAPSPAVAPPAPAPAPSAASAPDPLAIEARLLEAARACANARDYACASAKLAAYETRFPRGALSDEAALLRIEVARGRGDTVAARRLAERLLTSHPSGSYARRARAILAELDGPGDGAAP